MRFFLSVCILIMYSIGLGVSILPGAIGVSGFWSGCAAAFAVWLFVLTASLFYLEAVFANPDGANVPTISQSLLGKTGYAIGSIAFIYAHNAIIVVFFLYGILLFEDLGKILFGYEIPIPYIRILLALLIITFIYIGLRWCGWVATISIIIFLGTICFIFVRGTGTYHMPPFKTNWIYLLFTIPILYTTLFVQTIIPSLATFMKREWGKLKKVIWTGSFIGLLVNLIWLWLSISSTPEDLIPLEFQSYDTLYGLSAFLSKIFPIGNAIFLLMLLTFIGTFPLSSIVLVDFYFDLFRLSPEKRIGWRRLGITLLTIFPPFLFSHIPKLHIHVLINYTLGITLMFISRLFPLLWICSSRYIKGEVSTCRLNIGGIVLTLYTFAMIFLFYIEGVQLIRM
jgi:amino acid permease